VPAPESLYALTLLTVPTRVTALNLTYPSKTDWLTHNSTYLTYLTPGESNLTLDLTSYVLTNLLTYSHAYSLTNLPTYTLTSLLTYLQTHSLTYSLGVKRILNWRIPHILNWVCGAQVQLTYPRVGRR
jgi:hypothetical protein